jgi:hypothetical protein
MLHPMPHDDTMPTASHPSAPNRVSPSAASLFGFFMSNVMYSHRSIGSVYSKYSPGTRATRLMLTRQHTDVPICATYRRGSVNVGAS